MAITNDTSSAINGASVSTLDALWALISVQPQKVKQILASRLLSDLSKEDRNMKSLDKALEDVRCGRVSEQFDSAVGLFKHLGI